MFLGKFLRTSAVAAAVLAGLQLDAAADPVTYEGTVPSGGTMTGAVEASVHYDDATSADYWSFWATAGDSVTVTVGRIDVQLDPALWVYHGLFGDTLDLGLTSGTNDLDMGTQKIGFADDEIPNPGPFGDPLMVFTAPVTGWYTAAVTSYLSDPLPPGDKSYDYGISVRGNTGNPPYAPNPEPGTVVLLSGALAAAGAWRRRRAKRLQAE